VRPSIRLPVLATVAITGLALTLTGTATASAAPGAPGGTAAAPGPAVARGATAAPAAASGTKLWEARYAADGRGAFSYASAVSPDGSALFVTGGFRRKTSEPRADAATTIAYNATTGATLWQSSYNPGGRSTSVFNSIAVSPDSSVVFAAGGTQPDPGTAGPVLLVAYDAATGAGRWLKVLTGIGAANAVAASPGGSTVYVTGDGSGFSGAQAFSTVAYDAATGAQLWALAYRSPSGPGTASRTRSR
jgi:outer membrane protein assembly factor BamB